MVLIGSYGVLVSYERAPVGPYRTGLDDGATSARFFPIEQWLQGIGLQ